MLPRPILVLLRPAVLGVSAVLLLAVGYCLVHLLRALAPEHLSARISQEGTLVVSGAGFQPGERVAIYADIDETRRPTVGVADGAGRFSLDTGQPVTFECRMRISVDAPSMRQVRTEKPAFATERRVGPGAFRPLAHGYVIYPAREPGQVVLVPMNRGRGSAVTGDQVLAPAITDHIRFAFLVWTLGGWLLLGGVPLGVSLLAARRLLSGQPIEWPAALGGGVVLGLLVLGVVTSAGYGLSEQAYQNDLQALRLLDPRCPYSAVSLGDPLLGTLIRAMADVRAAAQGGGPWVTLVALLLAPTRRMAEVLLPLVVGVTLWGIVGDYGSSLPPILWTLLEA